MQPPPFVLNCLGTPRLLTAGGQEVRIKVKKHLAVLVILAVDGGKIRRERLVSMLWPTARPDRARGSVATAISVLRAKLGGDAIEPGRDWVQLRRGVLSLDLDRLQRGEAVGDEFTPPLEVDAFLAGFEIDQSPEFEEWRERQHARLLPAVEKGLVSLADHARRSGDLIELARLSDRLLSLNDLSEPGIRARMEAYALSGDRVTAIKLYDNWTARLRDEVKALPGRSIDDLAKRLRLKGWDRGSGDSQTPPVHTEQWRNQHFIGRTNEFRRLYQLWDKARSGLSCNVLITGDSGVGKTTLADRFATALALEGATVSRVRCYELESSIPFATLSSILGSMLDRPGAAAASPECLSELARLVPDIRRHFPTLPRASESTTGDEARLRFAEASYELLRALSDERPVLLVIDDLDQSDDVSIGILHMLMRRLKRAPLMVVLTNRNGSPSKRHELVRFRAGINDLGVETLDVAPLGADDANALLSAIVNELGLSPSRSERQALLRASGGFPLALELLACDWLVNRDRSTAFAVQAITSKLDALPEARYQQLTESLLAAFESDEHIVVHAAAVLDRRVGDLSLYQTAGLTQATTLATLARMLERRALRDTPTGLEWINPAVRAHAYLAIPAPLRSLLHDGVFMALSSRNKAGTKIPGLELAWHAMRAGRAAEGSNYLLSGAREAMLAGAARDAESALLSGICGVEPSMRTEANLCLAEVFLELERPNEAIELLQPLVTVPDTKGIRARLLHVQGQLGKAPICAVPEEIERVARLLYGIANTSTDNSVRARAVTISSNILQGGAHTDTSLRLIELGLSLPVNELPPADAVGLLAALAKHHYILREYRPCEELLIEALFIADSVGLRNSDYLLALNGLGAVACAEGRYERGLERSVQLFAACTGIGSDRYLSTAIVNSALSLLRLGRYRDACDWAARIAASPTVSQSIALATIDIESLASAMLGNREPARRSAVIAKQISDSTNDPSTSRRALLSAADCLWLAGDTRRSKEVALEGVALGSPEQDDPCGMGRFGRWLAITTSSASGLDRKRSASTLRHALSIRVDNLDRAELLGALSTLCALANSERDELQAVLADLPKAVPDQLALLGIPIQKAQMGLSVA